MPSDHSGKHPEEPHLLKAVGVDAFLNHDLDGLLDIVPAHEPLQVLIYHMARLRAGINGSSSHSKVQLPVVISR